MTSPAPKKITMPVGVVIERIPGVTRWATWSWRAVAVMPGAGEADWRILHKAGEAVQFHAATVTVELFASDTEAYRVGLTDAVPSIYVVLRDTGDEDRPLEVLLATASPYEAQDYADNGEDIVEKVPMPSGLIAWVRDFTDAHHEEEVFVKRRRDRKRIDVVDDGIGDGRISQLTDVYRAPRKTRAVVN